MARFLGELCNQRCAEAVLLPDMMHMILNHSIDGDIQDPHFRMKLIATLAIAGAFSLKKSRGSKIQMFAFLPYFEEFVMFFHPLPMDVELDVDEMYRTLNAKRPKHATYKDAQDALLKFHAKQSRKKSSASLHSIQEFDSMNLDEEENATQSDIGSPADESSFSEVEEESVRRFTGPSQEEESFERELALALGTNHDMTTTSHTMTEPKVTSAVGDEGSQKLSFKVMTKKSGKREKSKMVQIPVTQGVAQRLKENKEAEAAEKAALKRMVLASEF